MKLLKWVLITCLLTYSTYALDIKKEGLIPYYKPYEVGVMLFFLPYNPTVIAIGDRIADFTSSVAQAKERANVYGFSADINDFERLSYFGSQLPNLKPHFGLLNELRNGSHLFYSTLAHDAPDEFYYHFSGSLLKPTNSKISFLFGPSYQVPTFNFLEFCKSQKIDKIHLIYLDCGGNELSILKSIPEYLKDGIVVHLKTYHQRIRKGISQFQQIHELMTNQGYELFSHYIYDDVIGNALYVKSKYVSAVFRSKEL
ncbi:MAG: hypothetical protein RLZZ453_990 [Chlamydiota bacterium]|jgi:hypothetical protein